MDFLNGESFTSLQEFLKVILNNFIKVTSKCKEESVLIMKMCFINFAREKKHIEIQLRTGHFFGRKCQMFVFQDHTIQQRIFEVEHRDKTR